MQELSYEQFPLDWQEIFLVSVRSTATDGIA